MTTKTNIPSNWIELLAALNWIELLEASDALMSLLNKGVYGIDVVGVTSPIPLTQEEGASIAGILTRLDNAIKALKPEKCNAATITTT